MKAKFFLLPFFLMSTFVVYGQRVAGNSYWFFFTDKENNGYSINEPEEFLSQRSIDRRAWQSLPVDQSDMPVTMSYVDSLVALGLEVKYTSRWLNGIVVSGNDTELLDTLYQLDFIDSLRWYPERGAFYYPGPPSENRFEAPYTVPPSYSYGYSFNQINQLKIDFLHEKGYTGNGVVLAVLDAGFTALKELPAFITPVSKGHILAERNFVYRGSDIFTGQSHGTNVCSLILADWPDSLMGIAPDVKLLLALSENPDSETRLEEYSWIEAAEWADSLGADILNTSLGYRVFNDSTTNYTYSDMDGRTAHISIANGMTAAKGMISVTSAGNSGNDNWHYIGAPADAMDILAVGAVDKYGIIASFSSRGPSYDHRIKPDVSAMGKLAAVQSTDGTVRLGSGTSFSSPLISGATAVLWQAYPEIPARELMRWILEAGNNFEFPNIEYGYGIPNFTGAFHAITGINSIRGSRELIPYPNPFRNFIRLDVADDLGGLYKLKMYDLQGRKISDGEIYLPGTYYVPETLGSGFYILEVENGKHIFRCRLIKD